MLFLLILKNKLSLEDLSFKLMRDEDSVKNAILLPIILSDYKTFIQKRQKEIIQTGVI